MKETIELTHVATLTQRSNSWRYTAPDTSTSTGESSVLEAGAELRCESPAVCPTGIIWAQTPAGAWHLLEAKEAIFEAAK